MNKIAALLSFVVALAANSALAVDPKGGAKLEKKLAGKWTLTALTCAGKTQTLPMSYQMTFNGTKGEYISKTDKCTQRELETYSYLTDHTIAIKQGNRLCDPNPCDADLPATECGKETNPKLPTFKVKFKKTGAMELSTSDPNSIDCTGPGQSKPAVFEFKR